MFDSTDIQLITKIGIYKTKRCAVYLLANKCLGPFWAFSTILAFLLGTPLPSFTQTSPGPSAFYHIAEHTYGIKDGLPDMCMKQVLLDSQGKLHIVSCGSNYAGAALPVYEFDGAFAYPSEFKLDVYPGKQRISFEQEIAPDLLFGYYSNLGKNGDRRDGVFQYNAIARSTICVQMPEQALVQQVVYADKSLFACLYYPASQQVEIVRIQDGMASSLYSFNSEKALFRLAITESDYWLGKSAGLIYRINRKRGSLRTYSLPATTHSGWEINQMVSTASNELWVACGGIFYWNEQAERFMPNPYLPAAWNGDLLKDFLISKDLQGNVLLWSQNRTGQTSATLVDKQRQAFDYTAMAFSTNRTMQGNVRKWMSNDYKQGILFFFPDLHFVEFSTYKVVQKSLDFRYNRAIIQLDADRLYTARHGVLSNNQGHWEAVGKSFFPFSTNYDADLKKDKKGNIWDITKEHLCVYQVAQQTIETFYVGNNPGRFDFWDETQIALVAQENLYLINTRTGNKKLLVENILQRDRLNQLFVASDGIIWLAANEGLLKVDPQSGAVQTVKLLDKPTGIFQILEDHRKRLWLGSLISGILIYDPHTGSVQVIDRANGLSNNTVVSLLEDNDGSIWAGTYFGITRLSPEGGVEGKIFKKDGLADDECNRWSALKMDDGRLIFGSNAGLSFIDPALFEKHSQESTPPRIFLTGLSTEASGATQTSTDLLQQYQQEERIVLPATSQNIKIRFSLSNYTSPDLSIFAYKIEGQDTDWNYVGNFRSITLNNLPPGKFNIVIKGADRWGRWSDVPVVIPLDVQEYFYKKGWFFALCSLPFFGFFLLWQHRQRGEHQRLESEVIHRTAIIQEQADQLLAVDKMKSLLYTNITHEFRTPLTVILGMADLLEKASKAKELIIRNSQGLLRLVNQILDLEKLESGHLRLDMIQGDIIPYTKYLAESFQSFAERKNINLVFYTETESLVMDFDEKKLEVIMSNLLSNAIKYSKEHGKIIIHLRAENERLLIKVKDNGIGMSPTNLAHIFERFYQADNLNDRGQAGFKTGSGIGLTLSKELVELMGGEILVDSTLDVGTEFSVTLPIRNQAPLIALEKEIPLVPLGLHSLVEPKPGLLLESTVEGELPLLLLIEDNEDVAAYIQACLQEHYTIDWAENGAVGVQKALKTIPDAIISDVMMPVMDGFEVCQTLKNDEKTSHIPIILLTAKIDVASRLEGLGVGADAYLAKPFLKEELLIRLEKMVELRRKLQKRYARSADSPVAGSTETFPAEPTLDDLFLQKIFEHVEAYLDDSEFGNSQLAQKMLLSESQLFRKLKALTGQSTAIHIRSIRLHKAKELLQTTQRTVAEIAYETGFADPAYFSRTFSLEFGMAPGGMRKG